METVICTTCGGIMGRLEEVKKDGRITTVDWTMEAPAVCPVCRGIPGAKPLTRNHDVLGGFPWKRDEDGNKVPR